MATYTLQSRISDDYGQMQTKRDDTEIIYNILNSDIIACDALN